MHPDPKMSMSTEEAARNAGSIFESISNNLAKFLSLSVSTEPKQHKDGVYNSASTASVPDKRKQFEENLTLVKEGTEELDEAIRENLDSSKLVSPEKHSP